MKLSKVFRLFLRCIMISAVMVVIMCGGVYAASVSTSKPSGSGTEDNPYKIGTKEELYWFANEVNNDSTSLCAVLTKDIVVNEGVMTADSKDPIEWTPMAYDLKTYKGTFDGQGYSISGLYVNSKLSGTGFVGNLSDSGKIRRLSIINSYIYSTKQMTGIICGSASYGGTIEYCYSSGTVVSKVTRIGGICGYLAEGSIIKNCGNTANIKTGTGSIGGICGYSYKATIENCYSTGKVEGGMYNGVFCGSTGGKNYIKNSYCLDTAKNAVGLDNSGTAGGSSKIDKKSEEKFKSGEVCYLLNGSVDAGTDWYQNIDNGSEDNIPMPFSSHGKIYACGQLYSNYQYDDKGFAVTGENVYMPAPINNGVCEISNAGQLFWLGEKMFKSSSEYSNIDIKLMNNIIVNENVLNSNGELNTGNYRQMKPLGLSTAYNGVFDGQGYTISGMYLKFEMTSSSQYCGALFAALNTDSEVKNVSVVDSYVNNNNGGGGIIIGYSNGTVTDCYAQGYVVAQYAGGILSANGGSVARCYSDCSGKGFYCGGITGWNPTEKSEIKNCYAKTNFTEINNSIIGEICGLAYTGDKIINCCYLGTAYSGIGELERGSDATVSMTAEQFASGDACYFLNDSTNGGTNFYQNIDEGERDLYPVLDSKHNKVYKIGSSYSNSYGEKPLLNNGVYEIGKASELLWFAHYVNDIDNTINGRLTANIDLSTIDGEQIIIGNGNRAYMGNFDGAGFEITNLKAEYSSSYSGLFGYVKNGSVRNLTLRGSANITTSINNVGGIVGNGENAILYNLASYVNITNNSSAVVSHVGGIAGSSVAGTKIDKCQNWGSMNILESNDCIGGITGYANENVIITNSFNIGELIATKEGALIGGILGYVNNSSFGGIQNCYNYGKVSNNIATRCGAIIGWARSLNADNVINNYYIKDSCLQAFGTDSVKTISAEEKTAEGFANGEVCYLLNKSSSVNPVWYQSLGTDNLPKFEGSLVCYMDGVYCNPIVEKDAIKIENVDTANDVFYVVIDTNAFGGKGAMYLEAVELLITTEMGESEAEITSFTYSDAEERYAVLPVEYTMGENTEVNVRVKVTAKNMDTDTDVIYYVTDVQVLE